MKIKELQEYIQANIGNIKEIKLNEKELELVVQLKDKIFSIADLEKILDNNHFLEGLSYDYENIAIFDISELDLEDIKVELNELY